MFYQPERERNDAMAMLIDRADQQTMVRVEAVHTFVEELRVTAEEAVSIDLQGKCLNRATDAFVQSCSKMRNGYEPRLRS